MFRSPAAAVPCVQTRYDSGSGFQVRRIILAASPRRNHLQLSSNFCTSLVVPEGRGCQAGQLSTSVWHMPLIALDGENVWIS